MIVWSVVIGLIMVSLSLGNYLGGKIADKFNSKAKLYTFIWMASIWVAVIPLLGKYIIALSAIVLMWVLPSNLIVGGSVLSCLIIFSFPLTILGIVSPYLVKLGVDDIENNGKITGKIDAFSTIGSIIGTIVPTFVTIPYLGTSRTFYIHALMLNLLSLYYFIINREKSRKQAIISAITAIAITALLFAPLNNSYAFWKDVIVEEESIYNYLQVYEDGDEINLSTNVAFGVQSVYNKKNILSGSYYDYALMAPLFIKDFTPQEDLDVLILGMGTGTFAKQCKYFYPYSKIDGVEIDSKIVKLSREYFELKPEEANVFVNDGRTFLYSKDASKYDIIMVDAYHDITIPFHMSTVEFFDQVKEHLKEGGVIVININMRSEKNTEIVDYLTQTVKYNMQKVYAVNTKRDLNVMVYASDDPDCDKNFMANMERIKNSIGFQNTVEQRNKEKYHELAEYVFGNIQEIKESKLIFTDEIAPVEIMGQDLLDEIVKDTIDDFKEDIKLTPEGIKKLFNMISG